MKNSNKISRRQKLQISNKKKSIRKTIQKKIILKGGGLEMDKLLTPEFQKDYEEFNEYLDNGGEYHDGSHRNRSPQFDNILKKYFTRKLFNELKADREIFNTYLLVNGRYFKNLFRNVNFDELNLEYISIVDTPGWPYRAILKLLTNKRNCTTDELMIYNEDFDYLDCYNYNNYLGDCGYPSLQSSFKSHMRNVDKIESLFRLLRTKLEPEKKIGIIIGSIKPEEFDYDYDVNLYFNRCEDRAWSTEKCSEFKDIDTIIHEINTEPLKQDYLILNFFPLNTHPSHMPLLNLIIELMESYHIYLINNMCKTCFGSFYYLNREAKRSPYSRKFVYINGSKLSEFQLERVDPAKLGIQNCFFNF